MTSSRFTWTIPLDDVVVDHSSPTTPELPGLICSSDVSLTIGLKFDKSQTFHDRFSAHFGTGDLILKIPRLVPLWACQAKFEIKPITDPK